MPTPHRSVFFTGRMPFLPPNQQRQSTEGNKLDSKNKLKFHFKNKKLNCKNGLHDALG